MLKPEDFGIFVGMMTMPFKKEREFYKYEVEELFKKYRENIIRHAAGENNKPDDALYVPRAYCLFGSFDLLVIALVDDFALSVRN